MAIIYYFDVFLQTSWYDKLLEQLRNLHKRTKSSGANSEKTSKIAVTQGSKKARSSLLKRYPPRAHIVIDEDTIVKHEDAMLAEMAKKKPREVVILPLMKQTYSVTSDRTSVQEILSKYPTGLKLPSAVSLLYMHVHANVYWAIIMYYFYWHCSC